MNLPKGITPGGKENEPSKIFNTASRVGATLSIIALPVSEAVPPTTNLQDVLKPVAGITEQASDSLMKVKDQMAASIQQATRTNSVGERPKASDIFKAYQAKLEAQKAQQNKGGDETELNPEETQVNPPDETPPVVAPEYAPEFAPSVTAEQIDAWEIIVASKGYLRDAHGFTDAEINAINTEKAYQGVFKKAMMEMIRVRDFMAQKNSNSYTAREFDKVMASLIVSNQAGKLGFSKGEPNTYKRTFLLPDIKKKLTSSTFLGADAGLKDPNLNYIFNLLIINPDAVSNYPKGNVLDVLTLFHAANYLDKKTQILDDMYSRSILGPNIGRDGYDGLYYTSLFRTDNPVGFQLFRESNAAYFMVYDEILPYLSELGLADNPTMATSYKTWLSAGKNPNSPVWEQFMRKAYQEALLKNTP